MKGLLAGVIGFAIVIGMLVISYLTLGTWEAHVKDGTPVYRSKRDATSAGSGMKVDPVWGLHRGEVVRVLWDTHGKGYWACYVRDPGGQLGWVLCEMLQRTA